MCNDRRRKEIEKCNKKGAHLTISCLRVLDACASIAALEEGRSMNEEIAQSVEVQFFCE
jgi:hypothetical protein